MEMKKKIMVRNIATILLFANFVFFVKTASSNQRQYSIKGSIGGLLEGERVYLTLICGGGDSLVQSKKFDSTVVHGGDFLFTGSIPEGPRMFWMGFGKHTQFVVLVLSNENLTIKAADINMLPAGTNIREYVMIEGSETDRNWQDLIGLTKIYILFTNSLQRYMIGINDPAISDPKVLTGVMDTKRLFEAQMQQILMSMPNKKAMPVFLWNLFLYMNRELLVKSIYDSLSDSLKDSYHGKKIGMLSKLCVGEYIPDINAYGLDGKLVSLSNIIPKGKATYVHFWSSDCLPCIDKSRELIEQYNMYHNSGFNVFGVSVDTSKDNWLSALDKARFPGFQVFSKAASINNATQLYQVRALPASVLVDSEGKIICWNADGGELQWYLDRVFKR